jgi:hypothetical protein
LSPRESTVFSLSTLGKIQPSSGPLPVLPIHEYHLASDSSIRGRSDTADEEPIVISKSAIDDFMMSAHHSFVAAFQTPDSDDKKLAALQLDFRHSVAQGRTKLDEVKRRASKLSDTFNVTKERTTAVDEELHDAREKLDRLARGAHTMRATIARESEVGETFSHFAGDVVIWIMAYLIWAVILVLRVALSPFVATDKLPRSMSVGEAEQQIRVARRRIEKKKKLEVTVP